MFDAQSLLGGLLKQATGHQNLGTKAAMGMGALGVAIAAFEHFTQEKDSLTNHVSGEKQTPKSPPPIPGKTASPPPPPMQTQQTASQVVKAPTPPLPSASPAEKNNDEALLLIDAMLAAAHADGHIDSDEELKIIKQLYAINSDAEGFDYVQQRIKNPPELGQICSRSTNQDIAKQIYMVSLLAITVDNDAEEQYLSQLSQCLKLEPQVISELNQQFLSTGPK